MLSQTLRAECPKAEATLVPGEQVSRDTLKCDGFSAKLRDNELNSKTIVRKNLRISNFITGFKVIKKLASIKFH